MTVPIMVNISIIMAKCLEKINGKHPNGNGKVFRKNMCFIEMGLTSGSLHAS